MEYVIEYQTKNHFEKEVSEAIFELLVLPCNDESQVVISVNDKNSLNAETYRIKNFFGFELRRIRYGRDFNYFSYLASCKVKKLENPVYAHELSLEEENNILNSHDFYLNNHLYLQDTDITKIADEQKPLILLRKERSVEQFCQELNSYVHRLLEYRKNEQDSSSTARSVLELRSGVCQDFSHILIAMARANRIPARFVSGYLYKADAPASGINMLHAWTEVFIPGKGWIGYDPVNNCRTNENYIKIAHGQDNSDCSPFKGVLFTNGEKHTTYTIKVQPQ